MNELVHNTRCTAQSEEIWSILQMIDGHRNSSLILDSSDIRFINLYSVCRLIRQIDHLLIHSNVRSPSGNSVVISNVISSNLKFLGVHDGSEMIHYNRKVLNVVIISVPTGQMFQPFFTYFETQK